jgi:hypothetical protein
MAADTTLEKIVQDAASLPPEQQQLLIQMLVARLSRPSARKSIEQIAAEQGKGRLDFSEIRALGAFFPEDESVDDLIGTIRSLREDKSSRKLEVS